MVSEFTFFEGRSLIGPFQIYLRGDVEPTWFLAMILKHFAHRTTLHALQSY